MATRRNETLLSQEFLLYPNRKDIYTVTVTPLGIWYRLNTGDKESFDSTCVQFSDIIGCRCQKTNNSPELAEAFITIYSYPYKKKVFSSKRRRRRTVVIFEVNVTADFGSNLRIAENWRNVINCLSRNLPLNKEDVSSCVPPAPGKLLVLINPFSGQGKSLQIFENEVHPMLSEAEIPFKMQVTEHAGHAHEIIKKIVLSEWYGIVIVSGDGLIYEVINGLMERPDWEKAIHFPVGCLPGGSGNALCCSINYSAGEPIDLDMVLHSTFILIKHRVIPMDLVLVQTPSSRIYSFLSVTWGIMADIDFESERYRAIGEARFTLGALVRIMNLRKYEGRLSFLPVAEYRPKLKDSNNSSGRIVSKIRRFSWLNHCCSSDITSTEGVAHMTNNMNVGTFRKTCSEEDLRQSRNEGFSEIENGINLSEEPQLRFGSAKSERDLPKLKKHTPQRSKSNSSIQKNLLFKKDKITATASNGVFEIETETVMSSKSEGGSLLSPLLPPLDQPLPDNWVTIEDSFIFATAVYQTHLGSDLLAAPHAHLSDGFMYILFAREGISKAAIMSLLMAFADGSHIDLPNVEIVKALAFRLEPLTKDGNMMVDGEKVEYGPIQGQVLPQLGRIMAMQ